MNRSKKKVILVAYEFYPQNTGGSHRPFRMAKFLKQNGYDTEVLTIDYNGPKDESLQRMLSESVLKVKRIPTTERKNSEKGHSFYFRLVDDHYKNWKKNILKYFDKYSNYNKNITVIVTVPPFSLTQVVIELKKQYPNFNIILDFRDAWSQWNTSPYASWFHYYKTLNLEKKAIHKADHVLVTSSVTKLDIEKTSKIQDKKVICVSNSFDDYLNRPEKLIVKTKNKLSIGYVGSFYFNPHSHRLMFKPWHKKKPYQYLQFVPFKENWLYRTPYFLFKAIRALINMNSRYENLIELNFIGKKEPWLISMIAEFDLERVVNLHGFTNKDTINDFLKEQDCLLITSAKKEGKKECSIAGKTFEYFSIVKPILAFVTPGAQKDILINSGIAILIDPDNTNSAANQLKSLLEEETVLHPNYDHIDRYLTHNALKALIKIV